MADYFVSPSFLDFCAEHNSCMGLSSETKVKTARAIIDFCGKLWVCTSSISRFKNIPILDVKIERLKDIVGVDAMAEGFPRPFSNPDVYGFDAVQWYFKLWDKLNGDKLPAHVNPWVWVYKFPKYEGSKS